MNDYADMKAQQEIDRVLQENAMLFQNLGVDSTKTERNEAKAQEKRNLKAIKHLDPDKIDRLLKAD